MKVLSGGHGIILGCGGLERIKNALKWKVLNHSY